MKFLRRCFAPVPGALLVLALLLSGCSKASETHGNANSSISGSEESTAKPVEVARPPKISEMMVRRADMDKAEPQLKILSPMPGEKINDGDVRVKIALDGGSKGFALGDDPVKGNFVQVYFDDLPLCRFAIIEFSCPPPIPPAGEYVFRVFLVSAWGESFKNDGAFQIVKFSVKTNSSVTPTGQAPKKLSLDADKPLLTLNLPLAEFDPDEPVMVDFWLSNARLRDRGGDYRVRYSIDGGEPVFIDKWEAIWLDGLAEGRHSLKMELIDRNGKVVDNGGFNSISRELVIKQRKSA